jgi:hypothetical protein
MCLISLHLHLASAKKKEVTKDSKRDDKNTVDGKQKPKKKLNKKDVSQDCVHLLHNPGKILHMSLIYLHLHFGIYSEKRSHERGQG